MLKHCQINEWLLELISLCNFYFCKIITDELQKTFLFSSLGYGLIRIGKGWWALVLRKLHRRLGGSQGEMLSWGLKTLSELVRNLFLSLQKLQTCQKWVQEIMDKLSQTKLTCCQTSGALITVVFVWPPDYVRWEEAVVVLISEIVFKVSTHIKVEFLHDFLHV